MKMLLLPIVLGSQLVITVSDTVPTFDVSDSCKSAITASRSEDLSDAQALQACLNDEQQARQQLASSWTTFTAGMRDRCEGEATAGGLPSYVELLVCLQLSKDNADPSTVTTLKGARKKRS